jgi:hypothetical protein
VLARGGGLRAGRAARAVDAEAPLGAVALVEAEGMRGRVEPAESFVADLAGGALRVARTRRTARAVHAMRAGIAVPGVGALVRIGDAEIRHAALSATALRVAHADSSALVVHADSSVPFPVDAALMIELTERVLRRASIGDTTLVHGALGVLPALVLGAGHARAAMIADFARATVVVDFASRRLATLAVRRDTRAPVRAVAVGAALVEWCQVVRAVEPDGAPTEKKQERKES